MRGTECVCVCVCGSGGTGIDDIGGASCSDSEDACGGSCSGTGVYAWELSVSLCVCVWVQWWDVGVVHGVKSEAVMESLSHSVSVCALWQESMSVRQREAVLVSCWVHAMWGGSGRWKGLGVGCVLGVVVRV